MKFFKTSWKLFCTGLVLSLCIGTAVLAAEDQASVEESGMVAANTQIKELGTREADAIQIEITNSTGMDLSFFSVKPYTGIQSSKDTEKSMQEMLASEGDPEDTATDNLLTNGDIFAAGETRILYIPIEVLKDDIQEDDITQDAIADVLKEFSLEPEYVVTLQAKDLKNEYVLYAFPAKEMETVQLNLDNGTAYVRYTTMEDSNPIVTLEVERTVGEILHTTSEASGSDEPYVVLEEYYPSCDDPDHGVRYIEYSDGSTEQIAY